MYTKGPKDFGKALHSKARGSFKSWSGRYLVFSVMVIIIVISPPCPPRQLKSHVSGRPDVASHAVLVMPPEHLQALGLLYLMTTNRCPQCSHGRVFFSTLLPNALPVKHHGGASWPEMGCSAQSRMRDTHISEAGSRPHVVRGTCVRKRSFKNRQTTWKKDIKKHQACTALMRMRSPA